MAGTDRAQSVGGFAIAIPQSVTLVVIGLHSVASSCRMFVRGGNQLNEEKTIEASISEFIRVYNAGDLEGVLAYYSDDLIKVRQGGPAETKAETAKRVAGVFDKFHSRVDVINDEIRVSEEMAYTRGTFRVTLTPKSGWRTSNY